MHNPYRSIGIGSPSGLIFNLTIYAPETRGDKAYLVTMFSQYYAVFIEHNSCAAINLGIIKTYIVMFDLWLCYQCRYCLNGSGFVHTLVK